MIYTHVLNQGARGVRSPLHQLCLGLESGEDIPRQFVGCFPLSEIFISGPDFDGTFITPSRRWGAGVNWRLIFDSPPDGYELIVPDLRGHGRSTNPAFAVTFRQLALDVLALLESRLGDRIRFRGLLGLHSRCGPHAGWPAQSGRLSPGFDGSVTLPASRVATKAYRHFLAYSPAALTPFRGTPSTTATNAAPRSARGPRPRATRPSFNPLT